MEIHVHTYMLRVNSLYGQTTFESPGLYLSLSLYVNQMLPARL